MTTSRVPSGFQRLSYADWTSREAVAIARCFLTGQVHSGSAPAKLALALGALYAPSEVKLLNTAHHGIAMGLHCFKQRKPERTEVIVPAYICPSVPHTVRACGLHVRFVDVQDDLNLSADAVKQALGPNTLAVIAPHMYGSPAPIAEIEQACRGAGIALIDDAAQVVGVRANGRLLGTFGDMGVISFAQSKAIVTGVRGSGGVVLVNDPGLSEQINAQCMQLAPAQGRPVALLDFLLNDLCRRFTGGLGHHLARLLPTLLGDKRAPVSASALSNMDASTALVQLARMPEMVQEKTRISNLYWQALRQFPEFKFPQYLDGRYLSRVMLLMPECVNIERFRKNALKAGVETRLGYTMDHDVVSMAPNAALMVNRLIGVPSRKGMTETDVLNVCRRLHQSVSESHF